MDWSAVGWEGWAALAYATVLSLVVAYVIWNRSVQAVGPSRTAIYMCLTPLVAVIAAAWCCWASAPSRSRRSGRCSSSRGCS